MHMNICFRWAMSLLGMMTVSAALAANTVTAVDKVTSDVIIAEDIDYHITDSNPFSVTGSINITAVDHAVVIFDNVKPSKSQFEIVPETEGTQLEMRHAYNTLVQAVSESRDSIDFSQTPEVDRKSVV